MGFHVGRGGPSVGGTYTDCGLRNALNVKMLPLNPNMDYFLGHSHPTTIEITYVSVLQHAMGVTHQ